MNERPTKEVLFQINHHKKYFNTKLFFKKVNISSILLLSIRRGVSIVQVQSINKKHFKNYRLIIFWFEDWEIER